MIQLVWTDPTQTTGTDAGVRKSTHHTATKNAARKSTLTYTKASKQPIRKPRLNSVLEPGDVMDPNLQFLNGLHVELRKEKIMGTDCGK